MTWTIVRRLSGHVATGPSAVVLQSKARQSARISPGPAKMPSPTQVSSCGLRPALRAVTSVECSAIDHRHPALEVALARRHALREHLVDPLEIGLGERHAERADVVLEVRRRASCRGSGRCRRPDASSQASTSCAGVQPFFDATRLDVADEVEVLLEVLALEARLAAAEVVLGEILELREPPGEEAAAERASTATKPMPSSRQVGRISSSTSRIQSEYSVCSAAIGWTACARRIVAGAASRQPEVSDLAVLHELRHRADGLLDRDLGVDAVLVVEVDVVDAEALAAMRRTPCGRTPASRRCRGRCRRSSRTLPNFVASTTSSRRSLDRLADEPLVGERAVHVGGVEEVDAEVERAMDGRDRLRVVAPP